MKGDLTIVTSDRHLKPSQKWIINQEIVGKLGVIAAMTESFEQDYKELFLNNVQDESFKWVIYMFENPTYDVSTLDTELLLSIFKVCDYLDIQELQCKVARQLAKRMNHMDTTKMMEIIATIKDK